MTEPATHDPTPAAGSSTADADPAGLVTGRRTTRLDVGVGVLVGLVVAAVVLVWRSPLVPTDPWHYVMATLGIYMSIYNLFVNLLQLLMAILGERD